MTTEIQQNRYDQLLRRVGDLKGPGSKVAEVLSELFPTFDVENMPPELVRLSGARLAFGGGAITSAAAETPTGILENPAGSGKLITITTVHLGIKNTSAIRWGVTGAIRGTVISTQQFRDTRDVVPSFPTGVIRQISDASSAVGTNQTQGLANTDFELSDPGGVAVLSPGFQFEIGNEIANSSITYAFSWKERTAEPSELRP